MAFIEDVPFPPEISFGSQGGPGWLTTISQFDNGYESRNQNWVDALHQYDVSYGVSSHTHLIALKRFFMLARGRSKGFRFKDWADYASTDTVDVNGQMIDPVTTFSDQVLGIGDGIETVFQLVKNYEDSGEIYTRDIIKPVSGSVSVGVDGVEKTETTDYTIDTTTGIITFVVAPPDTEVITAGYQFDVPARFDIDQLTMVIESGGHGSASVIVKEIRI
jgi:uncharacterized protein (TIGR02217 family)